MKKTKYFPPYFKQGLRNRCTFKDCAHCEKSGVYFIRSKRSGNIVYVGQSQTQLYKTIYRHFQEWNDRQPSTGRSFERKTYPKYGYEVRYIKCTPTQALRLERYFIQKLQPKDNPLKYSIIFSQEKYERAEKLAKEAIESPYLPESQTILEEAPF